MSELALRQQSALVQADPEAEVEWASRCARALVRAIDANKQLTVSISGKRYIKVEGWQTLGAMTKVDQVEVVWCREYTAPGETAPIGWEARVEVRDRDGNVRGSGEAMCIRTENRWKNADEYAIRSMAQTRAMGKAYRMALSYVVSLAGYEATPAEEMPLENADLATSEQQAKIDELLTSLANSDLEPDPPHESWAEFANAWMRENGVTGRNKLTGEQIERLIAELEQQEIPFA